MPAPRALCALAGALLLAAGCSKRLYEGPPRPAAHVAVIVVGSTVVREIDGVKRRGGPFDASTFEVPPGAHRLSLVFELAAHSIGMKSIPAKPGEGRCVLAFTAEAGRQYYLGSRALGDWSGHRWDGRWEAWVRDPSVSADDDIIARCTSQPLPEPDAQPSPLIVAAPPAPVAPAAPAPAAPVSAPAAIAAPTLPAADAPVIRLGTWNLRGLGRGDDKDYGRIAAAIESQFDILTLTEVTQANAGGHPGLDRLLAALGDGWGGMASPQARPDRPGAGGEFYAIVYRRDRVHPCPDWPTLRFAGNGSGSAPFLREPAFGCFAVGAEDAPAVDFLLAAYRATSADGDAADVAAEVAHVGAVFAAMQRARPGEGDLLIAGDFNLEAVELPLPSPVAARSDGSGSLLDLRGEATGRRPDHILVYDGTATAELLGDATALDARGVAPTARAYYTTVSDHLPIMIRLRGDGADDD